MNTPSLQAGDIVSLVNPETEAEKSALYVLTEIKGDRVNIRLVCDLAIPPIECVPASEIKLHFRPYTLLPGQRLHFAEGELFTTFHDRPESTVFVVDDEAQKIVDGLDTETRAYASDPARGEFRGFAAMHDLFDANAMLPGVAYLPTTDPETLAFWNAVMDAVTKKLSA